MAENKIKNPIKVERETFEMDDKQYFSYFIRGTVRGKDVKVAIVPPDKGGYVVLDIVFDGAMEAELVVIPYEMKDDNGKTIKGNTKLLNLMALKIMFNTVMWKRRIVTEQ